MTPDYPLAKDIVLIGGGHAHALLLREWGMNPLPGARLTLINPSATAPYTGMLPGFVAGHYSRDMLEIDLVRLARFAGARMIFGKACGIDREKRLVHVNGRPPIAYDFASFDIGITSDMPKVPGFQEHAIAAKPLGPFADRWRAHLEGEAGSVVVVGGGVAGIELALAMAHALGERGTVHIVEAESALRGVSKTTAARLREELDKAGIGLSENVTVTEVFADTVRLSDGTTLPSSLTVGAAGARPFDWLTHTGLDLQNGYIAVGPDLRSTNDPNVFAVGDCAHLTASPRPKAGVFAVRAAPILTRNLRAAEADRPLAEFRPQSRYLKLISLGGKSALADRHTKSFGGPWAWRWKDWIDRRFMDRLNQPPDMGRLPNPGMVASGAKEAQPMCGGCGSKLGSDVLASVLGNLPSSEREDVETGAGDDAAVLRFDNTRQVITTDHLRAFWNDPWLFGRIAAIHALGDVWSMGAVPQAALAQITLPRLTSELQHRTLQEIMTAASDVFRSEGAEIVGGHSTQGAELTIGFTVTGLKKDRPLTLNGARVGDSLILTRPVGSGTLFAAEMQGLANGDNIEAALAIMATPQGDAARLLAPVAHAMTDVTGFGLAGHAAKMADASNLSAEFELADVPCFEGAEGLADTGIRSTIWQANRDSVQYDGPDGGRATLLFDPQTAGGLLAAVPEKTAEAIRSDLVAHGHRASIVGRMARRQNVQVVAR